MDRVVAAQVFVTIAERGSLSGATDSRRPAASLDGIQARRAIVAIAAQLSLVPLQKYLRPPIYRLL